MRFSSMVAALLMCAAGGLPAAGGIHHVAPSATGNGSGSDDGNLMAWATYLATAPHTGDTVYVRNMTYVISGVDWPSGATYYGHYVKMYSTYSIAWTWMADKQIGQFVNHDPWVVGPIDVNVFDPASTLIGDRIKNGSQINPRATDVHQGYDNKAYYQYGVTYDHKLNVAFDVNDANALTVPNGSSLVSSMSIDAAGNRPQLQTAAVLTVLSSAPAQDSFRPAHTGLDKTVVHDENDLNYALLASLAPTAHTPALSAYETWFTRPWLDHIAGWVGACIQPLSNMPYYGADIANITGCAALELHLNYTNAQKRNLLVGFVQTALDTYGVVVDGGIAQWPGEAGHGHGRKVMILMAGILLNDAGMKAIGNKSGDYLTDPLSPPGDYVHFGEDDETFYIAAVDKTDTWGQYLTGNSWTYRATADGHIAGTIVVGHSIVQTTTNATGTVLAIKDQIDHSPPYRDWVGIQWNGAGSDFDCTGSYVCTDQTSGGTFTPDHRTRWDIEGTWTPDTRDMQRYGEWHLTWPEWGIWHCGYPQYSNAYIGTEYRLLVEQTFAGTALPSIIMQAGSNAKILWNHPSFFDTTDRWMQLTADGEPNAMGDYVRTSHLFAEEMWDTYRAGYGDEWAPSGPPPTTEYYYIWHK